MMPFIALPSLSGLSSSDNVSLNMDSVYLGEIIDVVEIPALGSFRHSLEGISQLYSDCWGLWPACGRSARDCV